MNILALRQSSSRSSPVVRWKESMRNKVLSFLFCGWRAGLSMCCFFVLPSLMGFFYAFTDWNSYSSEVNFVGLENFAADLFVQPGLPALYLEHHPLHRNHHRPEDRHRPGTGGAADQGVRRLAHLHRMVMYLPAVLPMLVVSLIFKSILNPATGLLNTLLRGAGPGFSGAAMAGEIQRGHCLR